MFLVPQEVVEFSRAISRVVERGTGREGGRYRDHMEEKTWCHCSFDDSRSNKKSEDHFG